ncbi:unnamed protein product [Sphagnum balticum]
MLRIKRQEIELEESSKENAVRVEELMRLLQEKDRLIANLDDKQGRERKGSSVDVGMLNPNGSMLGQGSMVTMGQNSMMMGQASMGQVSQLGAVSQTKGMVDSVIAGDTSGKT